MNKNLHAKIILLRPRCLKLNLIDFICWKYSNPSLQCLAFITTLSDQRDNFASESHPVWIDGDEVGEEEEEGGGERKREGEKSHARIRAVSWFTHLFYVREIIQRGRRVRYAIRRIYTMRHAARGLRKWGERKEGRALAVRARRKGSQFSERNLPTKKSSR